MFIFILIALLVILLEALKIALLSAVYTFFILSARFLFIKIAERDSVLLHKFKPVFWSLCLLLCAFCFSYYGNRGWVEEAYLPIGYGKSIANSDHMTYFDLENKNTIDIDSFIVRKGHLCFASDTTFYDYQLATRKLGRFNSKDNYENYAKATDLPLAKEFEQFQPQYDAYWNGWRFWLLP
jgi:hypothetical protein